MAEQGKWDRGVPKGGFPVHILPRAREAKLGSLVELDRWRIHCVWWCSLRWYRSDRGLLERDCLWHKARSTVAAPGLHH